MAAFRKKPQRWPLLQPNAAGIVGCCGGIGTDGTTSSTHIASPLLIVLAGHPISQFETILALLMVQRNSEEHETTFSIITAAFLL